MTNPPDPAPVLELLAAFRTSAVLFASCSLGVFDQLTAAPASLSALAGRLGADADALRRLLDACVGLGLLSRDGDVYANTPVAQAYLSRQSPRRLTGYATYSQRVLWPMWANLADAVREGGHRWKQTFDLDGPIFANFFRTE